AAASLRPFFRKRAGSLVELAEGKNELRDGDNRNLVSLRSIVCDLATCSGHQPKSYPVDVHPCPELKEGEDGEDYMKDVAQWQFPEEAVEIVKDIEAFDKKRPEEQRNAMEKAAPKLKAFWERAETIKEKAIKEESKLQTR
ncbi:unnamed protein product, partial [Amoebophrya sp. A25]